MTDAKACGSVNKITSLSYFTASLSGCLAIGTITLHAIIILSIIKDRRKKFQHFFYKLLLNISIADILCGLLTDPYSAVFHAIEGLHQKHVGTKPIHIMLFLFGSVPLATLIVLCVDRILALLKPLTYGKGLQGLQSWLVILATWVISTIQIMAYFELGFIGYLMVFASVNISGAMIAMIVTAIVYYLNIGKAKTKSANLKRDNENGSSENEEESTRTAKRSLERRKRENNATKTFLIMLIVIVVTYLPTCFATGYMNACENCNCAIVHSLRDVAFVSILGGPLLRAINLLVCLKPLRQYWRVRNASEFSSTNQR